MEIISLLIGLISGAVGGNIAGAAQKEKNFGFLGNTIIGLLGGGAGNLILQALGVLKGGMGEGQVDISSLLGNIGGSGVSGAIVLLIVSMIKSKMDKK